MGDSPEAAAARTKAIREPDASQLVPLRATMEPMDGLRAIFGEVTRELGIPVAAMLPAGHGPGKSPLPLGGMYELKATGELKLLKWEWPFRRSRA
jgi:hypothetical protein